MSTNNAFDLQKGTRKELLRSLRPFWERNTCTKIAEWYKEFDLVRDKEDSFNIINIFF